MSIDLKCAITTAILSVLVYILLVELLTKFVTSSDTGKTFGKPMDDEKQPWYGSMEFMMVVAVFLSVNLNNYLFSSCKSA